MIRPCTLALFVNHVPPVLSLDIGRALRPGAREDARGHAASVRVERHRDGLAGIETRVTGPDGNPTRRE